MSAPAAFVHVELDGRSRPLGRLWVTATRGRESATFEYDDGWLDSDDRFALEPALQLHAGPFHTRWGQPLFGALGDSAPDRWGRTLIARAERIEARAEGRTARTLRDLDYLLGVNDELRQGALRFTTVKGGPYLAVARASGGVPPLLDLAKLLAAANRVLERDERAEDLRLLLGPGASLGGARPKASVRDRDGSLLIAKFPGPSDPYDVVAWEAVALRLAARAGIRIPEYRLIEITGRSVLLVRRFDRTAAGRVPFLSAMSALGATDREVHSYPEIADVLRPMAAAAREDLAALWRRVVFNVLISNTDDHLRNHAFLYVGRDGWRLSPAYDLNPVPTDVKPRLLATTITEDPDPTASLELAMEVASHFGLDALEARGIVGEVSAATRAWRRAAAALGIGKSAIDGMESAFQHEDARLAATM